MGLVLTLGGLALTGIGLAGSLTDGDGAVATPTTTTGGPSQADIRAREVEDFYARLVAAIRTGDGDFLFSRFHPAVLDRYGGDQCRAALASAADPEAEIEVLSVGEPERWTWEMDGVSTDIEDAIPVELRLAGRIEAASSEAHVATVDGELRWFTDCGEPV